MHLDLRVMIHLLCEICHLVYKSDGVPKTGEGEGALDAVSGSSPVRQLNERFNEVGFFDKGLHGYEFICL